MATEVIRAQAEQEAQRIGAQFFEQRGSRETIAGIRTELNRTMESGAGLYRTEASLRETCDTIRQLQRRIADVVVTDRSQTFNTELTTALELGFLLDAAEALAHSALGRKESRGAHQRTDYPRRDDQSFLKHSLAYRTEGDPRVEYRPVVITRWPPGERIYGAKH